MCRGPVGPYAPSCSRVWRDGSNRNSFPPRQRVPRRGARCAARPPMTQVSQASMLVATVPAIEGRPVQWYLGIVSGEAVAGDRPHGGVVARGDGDGGVGCRAGARAVDLRDARDAAIFEMLREAAERGANAVIGVDPGYAPIHAGGAAPARLRTASGPP